MVTTKRVYDSVSAFLDVAESPIPDMGLRNSSRESGSFMSHDWDFSVGWEGAVRLCEDGWPEGRDAISKFTHQLKTVMVGKIKLPEVRYDVEGMDLDYGRYHIGHPEAAMRIVDSAVEVESTPPRIVRIIVNSAASAAINAKVLEMRGAAVVALADLLEMHHVRADIDLVSCVENGASHLETWVKVKQPDFPMQMDNLAFHLVHPASFRRIMFADWEHMDRNLRQSHGIYSGYGTPSDIALADRENCIYLGAMLWTRGGDWSEAFALQWIVSQLEAQGIEVNHGDDE